MTAPPTANSWIVFYRAGALGDFLLSMPLFRVLGTYGRPVCLIARRAYLDVVPPGCRVDQFTDVDSPAAGILFGGASEATSDLARCLPGSSLYLFCSYDQDLEMHCRRIGVSSVCWLDPRPARPPHVAHWFFRNAGLASPPNLLATPMWPGPRMGRDLWIHPGSGSRTKNASPRALAERAVDWHDRHGTRVWISYGEADLELRGPFEQALNDRGVHFETLVLPSLNQLRDALVRHAALYVGNDSGVTHLAGLLGIPTIAVFIVTDPRIWRPIGHCTLHSPESFREREIDCCKGARIVTSGDD